MGFYHCFKNGPNGSIRNRAPVRSNKISKTGQNRDELEIEAQTYSLTILVHGFYIRV